MYILKLSYNDENGDYQKGKFFSGFGMSYRRNYEIFEPVLETEVNSVGHFSFTIYPSHPMYDYADKPRTVLEILKYGISEPLFVGRPAECKKGLYNEKILTFESELAFMLDTVRTDFTTTVGHSCEYWFKDILEYHNTHNSKFGDFYENNVLRKFEPGKISRSFTSSFTNIPEELFSGTYSTLEIISKLLLEKYGGVLKIRHEGGVNYVDWLAEEDLHVCSQKIELSKNLISIENCRISDELATAIRPTGENVDSGSGESIPLNLRLHDASEFITNDDIVQMTDKTAVSTSSLYFMDILYSKSLVSKYGWICREVMFEGATSISELVKQAEKYLLNMSEAQSITITAADLASADNSIENFVAGDMVSVNSQVHLLSDAPMLITATNLNLSDPTACEITLGNQSATITSQLGSSTGTGITGGVIGGSVSGKYDPEGAASAALSQAKKYTDSIALEKVDKISGKGLSSNDFTDEYIQKINKNISDISSLNQKTDASNSVVNSLSTHLQTAFTQISQKANSDDVYTKTETDSRITSKVSEIVAGAPEDFDTLKEMSDWLTNHEDSAAEMNTAITKLNAELTQAKNDISDNTAGVIKNLSEITLNKTTLGYQKKNLLKNNAKSATVQGVTITVNDDKSITVSGANTGGTIWHNVYGTSDIPMTELEIGQSYILSGTPTDNPDNNGKRTAYLRIEKRAMVIAADFKGNGVEFTVTSNVRPEYVILCISGGADYTDKPITFYPMIRHAEVTDSMYEPYVDDVNTMFEDLKTNITDLQTNKLSISSNEYVPIKYISGKKNFNADFQLSINDPNKVIFFNNDKTLPLNSPFGSEANPYMLIVERIFSSTSVISDIRQTCVYVKSAGSEGSSYVEKQREYKGQTDVWTDWKKCGQSAIESVSEEIDRFEEQPLLYSNTASGSSPHTVNVTRLFTNYSSVICNIVTSTGRYSLTLPLKYIKSLGKGKYYYADVLLFSYVDDDNLRIDTGLGQSNPTISSVNIIGLY